MNSPVIAVDGPSGVGKGTVCQYLVKQLGWHYLDSGALYRILAYVAMQQQLDLQAATPLAALAASLNIRFVGTKIYCQEQMIRHEIRTEACAKAASIIATHDLVRTAFLQQQRQFQKAPGLVADGRDMASVVFPKAEIKLFLTANFEIRAKRRYKQLKEQGKHVNLSAVLDDVKNRDARDKSRQIAPLVAVSDAIVIDTTEQSIDQVNQHLMEIISKKLHIS